MQTLTGKYRIFSGLRTTWPWLLVLSALLYACQETGNAEKKLPSYDEQARNAVLLPLDSFTNTPLIQQRVAEIRVFYFGGHEQWRGLSRAHCRGSCSRGIDRGKCHPCRKAIHGDQVQHLADRRARVGEHGHLGVVVRPPRDGGVRDAVLSHHAAEQQFVGAQVLQGLVEGGGLEGVGVLLDDHRRTNGGGADSRMQLHALSARVEERRSALGDVLDKHNGYPLRAGLGDGLLRGRERRLGVPKWKGPALEIVVLNINDDENRLAHGFLSRVVVNG